MPTAAELQFECNKFEDELVVNAIKQHVKLGGLLYRNIPVPR